MQCDPAFDPGCNPEAPDDDGFDDGDGINDAEDNCPTVYNPGQENADGDAFGDACDPFPLDPSNSDTDGDGVGDPQDNCPTTPNADQLNSDGDELGDACDPTPQPDADSDGVSDPDDNCPTVANADQTDTDADGIGDACDEPELPTIDEVIAELRAAILQLEAERVLNHGQAKKLSDSVDDIVRLLATAPPEIAIQSLRAFIGGVNALVTSGRLTAAQAALLIEPAEDLIAILGS
jgi:hypothetical protein